MQVFMSYSAADRKFAERLRDELTRDGLSIWTDTDLGEGAERREKISKAIRAADDILILVGAHSREDTSQQLTWQKALEAAWQDSRKRLIPVLLRGAALPPFVYGDSSGSEAPVVLIPNPRDLRSSVQAILSALERRGRKSPESYPVEADAGSVSAIVDTKGNQSYDVEGARDDRLVEIKQFAESLKNKRP